MSIKGENIIDAIYEKSCKDGSWFELMYLYFNIVAGVCVIFVSCVVLWVALSNNKNKRIVRIHDASLTCEELEEHAKEIAFDHVISKREILSNWPLPRMNDNYNYILSVYKELNEDTQKKYAIPPAAEWLLDNFYIIEEQVKGIRRDLVKKEYYHLPVLKCGNLRGYARIYAIVMELVSHTDGLMDERVLLNYMKAYQSHNVLSDRELWAIPIMIRIALIENIRYVSEKIKEIQYQWRRVDELLDNLINSGEEDSTKTISAVEYKIKTLDEFNPSYIEHFSYRLRRAGRGFAQMLGHIDEKLAKHGLALDVITRKEHNTQAVNAVSMGNCIISLKLISSLDWIETFEALSYIEQILKDDPEGVYSLMDLPSKNYYRKRIEEIAALTKVSELHVAKEAVGLAEGALKLRRKSENNAKYRNIRTLKDKNNQCEYHVGYYLIGKGVQALELKLGYKPTLFKKSERMIRRYNAILYLMSIFLLSLIITVGVAIYSFNEVASYKIVISVLTAIIVLIPASDIAINLVNWIICNTIKPKTFPRLELKEGIPEDFATMVVIPALLTDSSRVKELLGNLETHYLANKEQNIYFALAGDFNDSNKELEIAEEKITNTGISGVRELNKKYCKDGNDIFYYFHRHRQFNERQNKWMGWERKRGALIELNDMLLGKESSSYTILSNKWKADKSIKYVITLDADTILPMGEAKKMIGSMAHPLNRPVIDEKKGIVVEGYGLVQPRVVFDIESANKSLFSRIFTGQEGIDPYASAISDVYQDLFGEGIFTGKGIYDINVFNTILRDAIPENAILSHDLLEGSYVRAGLATDIELVDGYPSRYNSYALRMHRWVRGDWQLTPWLKRQVIDRNGRRVKNPLSIISKWKIIDNLRRSLVAPSILIVILLSFCLLPGSIIFWLGFSLVTQVFGLISAIIGSLVTGRLHFSRTKRHARIISGIKATFLQTGLLIIFLPYQAYLMANAIALTISRLCYSKKNMLEWVTAADVEKKQKNSVGSFLSKMFISEIQGLLVVLLSLLFKPKALIAAVIIFIVWGISPFIAFWISKTKEELQPSLSLEDTNELRSIARKTWCYFEEFANHKSHYLAPDNYQEDPLNGVAYRTSPTNIGLGLLAELTARDLGYIGIYEMTDLITNTILSIEKMEKWNGHLYNWYNTRNLSPLRPRYISTVDSGNLVCYLITLVQGMEERLNDTLVDTNFVQGIKDTVSFLNKEASNVYPSIVRLYKNETKILEDVTLWSLVLDEFSNDSKNFGIKKSRWKIKVDHMINAFKRELAEFMPWIENIKNSSNFIADISQGMTAENFELLQSTLEKLKLNYKIKELPSVCQDTLEVLDKLRGSISSPDTEKTLIWQKWLLELMEAVKKSSENSSKFLNRYIELIERINSIAGVMEFKPLYVEKKQLFSIGYNIEENRLTNSFYDLMASEARQTSYIAIARGEVPVKHWFKLGRALTVVDRYKGLVSWTGTMFEYLMPLLIMKSYRNTLLDETYSFVVRSQKKYGKQREIPWGSSESGFYSLDINLDYQYKAIGVPWLGLKRGLIEDAVVTPYAVFLALPLDPINTMDNILKLKKLGMDGPYGFYEAIDYTPERLPFGLKHAIIKSYMAHHQGMSLLSLNNYLNASILQKRFHSNPTIKAAQLLLQEKVPTNLVFTKESKEKITPFKDVVFKEKGSIRKYKCPDPSIPKVHLLSNGNYTVMITDRGTGFSKTKQAEITRWREDSTLDSYGMFFYIRDVDNDKVWSTSYQPYGVLPDKYEVIFMSHKAEFKRTDGDICTETDITVASGDSAEVRRISIKNNGKEERTLELTSYFEVVLAPKGADAAHPAFSNLFVRTEYVPEFRGLIANRKPRTETDRNLWISNTVSVEGEMVGDVQYETDRMQFIGRGRTVNNPIAMERNRPLSNACGSVLDPVISIRLRVKIQPGQIVRVAFATAVAEDRDSAVELMEKYCRYESAESAFRLALTRSQVETRYLNIKAFEIELYQDMISHLLFISPLRRLMKDSLVLNKKGQSSLWSYGISGDLPIVFVILKRSDETDIVYEALKAHEYWKIKDLRVDLVILNEEENSYTHPLHTILAEIISSSHAHDIINKSGGVFVLNRSNLSEEIIALLISVSRLVLKGNSGSLSQQVQVALQYQLPEFKKYSELKSTYEAVAQKEHNLKYFNGLGGFSEDGSEYVIRLEAGQNTPLPWINVISNPNFGFLVSEAGSGYTWSENSRENKLSPWSNDSVSDLPGEAIYMTDEETGEIWSTTPLPVREDEAYTITHGFGYSNFQHTSHGIEQNLVQFVPINEAVKISVLKLRNLSGKARCIKITYYLRPVLGVSDQLTSMHINTQLSDAGVLMISNPYNEEFAGRIVYMDVSQTERCVTGDRKEFFGAGKVQSPEGLKREKLSGAVGTGYDPCGAIQVNITLEAEEEKEVLFMLGCAKEMRQVSEVTEKYRLVSEAKKSLAQVKQFWKEKLHTVQVKTFDSSMDIMINGWLIYQVVSCRIWARSAFYQSGGAFGFRDQLQDSLAVVSIWPEITRSQILLHSCHQFKEGDVQHWWHEPDWKGTRTRFSDDLLWLPYVTSEYISITGDMKILDEKSYLLDDEPLKDFEDERYSKPGISDLEISLYEHCIRSIEKAIKFGEHGIPLMGSGDWNDGMNTVGNKGKGESVWLGWFLYSTLIKFAPICKQMGEDERAKKYIDIAKEIAESIEKNAWDGDWYRRAYFDNGNPLGSIQNSECKIDSISQTWAVISGAGKGERVKKAMNSLENYLVQREEGIIKLLTPPFDDGESEPGYIKGYVPGVRENGGQYTHAAAWVIIAFAELGDGDKALELFELINPINHSRTHMEYSKYKVEPYVMAADVYAALPHVGRGGWTWYTGSASWVYKAGLEYILGIKKLGNALKISPCIPKKWSEYSVTYKYLETTYEIKVGNPEGVCRGVKSIVLDGRLLKDDLIALENDGGYHIVEVVLGNLL